MEAVALREALKGISLLGFDTARRAEGGEANGAKPAFVSMPPSGPSFTKRYRYVLTSTDDPANPNQYTAALTQEENFTIEDVQDNGGNPDDLQQIGDNPSDVSIIRMRR